jgi:hypothetical protein
MLQLTIIQIRKILNYFDSECLEQSLQATTRRYLREQPDYELLYGKVFTRIPLSYGHGLVT